MTSASQAGSPPEARPDSVPTSVSAAPKTIVIESPMVGTYYSSSAPDAPPFVSVGSVVHPETTVCIIEAMKVFTDIPAGVSGTIAEILVKNGQAVEFGQPLFRVIPELTGEKPAREYRRVRRQPAVNLDDPFGRCVHPVRPDESPAFA